MTSSIIIQEFNNYFAYVMYGILQGLCDFPYTSLYLILGISLVFHIISLRKWFNNRAKNETSLEMIQSLQTSNEQLVGKINTLERDTINLTHKIQSMPEDIETLSERIHASEINNRNVLKIYDRLMDKVSLQEDNMYGIKIMFTDKMLPLLDKLHTLESSVRSLEQKTGQEIQTLRKSVEKRLEKIEEFIKTDEQGQNVQGQDLASSVHIPDHCEKHVSPGKLNPVPTVKNHTLLDDGIEMEDESKTLVGNRKRMFWQTSINDQRPNLRVCINDIVIEGMIDTGADFNAGSPLGLFLGIHCALCCGELAALGLWVRSSPVLQQIIDEVNVGAGQVITLGR
ncbi:uncharacterized protein LOC121677222 [Arvicola amphibius]|uniref:uncharacterized protein LOC121677222 n=1 Tax=Arvicola amphibius TaxID=1047088 RepID=UPI001C097793|nr:uncharacterized protein LOC121677222 [Arvicola amphibius]